jgi:hypothetical protein
MFPIIITSSKFWHLINDAEIDEAESVRFSWAGFFTAGCFPSCRRCWFACG